MGTAKAHLRSLSMGAFYGALVFVADRCIHLKGTLNITLLVIMSILSLLVVVGTFKVDPQSRFHIPLKPFSILLGFMLSIALVYAFLGNMPGQRNFIQTLADAKTLPPAMQKPFDKYVDWSARHSLIGNGKPEIVKQP
ncbi:MAG: hypothetical protein K0R10_461 [Alphaproteobacteria bacterium]|jgi:hypothetical protein|nr:hypothetical protein [Alphaproteobacteria bacterium]